ncbi:methionine synthase [Anaerobacillus isosaccharinicus]|uniref:Methionine synthase n=1 Tax=Anaerobacillus isosaccharinicus TaxID=1532552 RepID=A0A1S2KXI0_9BACI|nr:methionine synthase [Anaerobacillus isosaccharinicus]MBA5585829.1 methionine synthase [Anaerobacillus isosaccharinicus]QOY35875.1 methionine synthase [Anaerobacillus isosaccharinicus]
MKYQSFQNRLQNYILVLDGAMGTMLQNKNLTAEDFGGEEFEGCNEYLNITAPDVIQDIHEAYLEAGADIIETNTFGATNIVLADYDLQHLAIELNQKAAEIAKIAVEKFSTEAWPRYVAGSMGPTTKSLSVTGGATFEDLIEAYEQQAYGLLLGGVDLLLIETSQDTRNVKAAYIGIEKAFEKLAIRVPLMISGTIEPMGTTLAGQNIEAFYLSIEHMKPVVVGLNCATGPEFMQDHLRSLASLSSTAVICFPNAGLPDEEGHYHESPEMLARKLKQFAQKGWLNVVGGCCGTTPEHIKAIREAVEGLKPRQLAGEHPHALSGIEPFIYDETMRPLLVGERTNVIGSKKFKVLIKEGKFEEASEIARAQVKKGAHIIDICLADPDSEEVCDMENFLPYVVNKVKVPLMIDSTDEKVLEKALTYCQGKAVINSINLEDGEERFESVVPIIHRYGAAVVVGTIDEIGMAVTAERKLEVALRSYDLLVSRYGVRPQDIIFDPLVFPVGTGDEQYIGSAKATVEGIRLIKEKLPQCLTILGVSNVSFGLPPVGREILNSVFLYHCTQAGLDYAIVNTEKLERFASIKEEERILAEKVLFETADEVLAEFTAFYRGKKKEDKKPLLNLTLEERLQSYIIEGTKEGLVPDLELALQKYETPLAVINGPLMAGMDEVGKLFNNNELIVAEVLQSAEVMKASVQFLEQFMEKKDDNGKGKILLATVKGDVHDIGKNLVEIILSNNGFKVVNLGIKVTSNQLIEAIKKENPDAIGLSGLLVKSAQQMVLTATDLKEQQISIPILVGGAALTRKFTETKIQQQYGGNVLYAKDAMNGLELANQLFHKDGTKIKVLAKPEIEVSENAQLEENVELEDEVIPSRSDVSTNHKVAIPSDLKKRTFLDYRLSHIKPYINIQTLLGKHLGLKGKVERLIREGNEKAVQLKEKTDELFQEIVENEWLKARGVYQFFPAQSEGNDIIIYDPNDYSKEIERFTFPRQRKAPHLCLADFIRPKESGEIDYVGFFVVTAGLGVRELSTEWKEKGDYLRSHLLQALALELAEAFAEHLHHLMRNSLGIPDDPDLTMQDRFSARYQGVRVSYGYPACPELADQKKLFGLLNPVEIGIELTEEYMMDPEASVSAMVFAHPEGRYFNVE